MRYCRICEREFIGNTNSAYCSNECAIQGRKLNYQQRQFAKNCKYCGKEFFGTKTQRICGDCKSSKKIEKIYDRIEISVLCRVCGSEMFTEIKNKTIHNSSKRIGSTCLTCHQAISQQRSNRMKTQNPMFKPEVRARVASTLTGQDKNIKDYLEIKTPATRLTKEQVSKLLSNKMLGDNNPMKKEDVRYKVSKTLKEKHANDEYSWPSGSSHWLWKGNRERCQTIRSRLYPVWIRPILERDKFTCCCCGKHGGKLEVHHIDPSFQNIIEIHLEGRVLVNLTDAEFAEFSNQVIEAHKKVRGITYCRKCHMFADGRLK